MSIKGGLIMPAPENKKYTADEFFNITKDADTERYELYKGEIIVLASPSIIHQRISREVSYALNSFIKSSGGKCEVFTAPTDVKLSEDTVVIPDIFIACDPDKFDKQKYRVKQNQQLTEKLLQCNHVILLFY